MALIADVCPRCARVTRCRIVRRTTVYGGLLFYVPFVLPVTSSSTECLECGQTFSGMAPAGGAVPEEAAAGMSLDKLLDLTNPALREVHVLAGLRPVPRLRTAFLLLDRLPRGPLHAGLRAALVRWPSLDDAGAADFLGRVEMCERAEAFARSIAPRYAIGASVYVVGFAGAASVLAAAVFAFPRMSIGGWVLTLFAGLAAGGAPCRLLWLARDRRFVRDVLLPESGQAGVRPEWLLAVIEGSGARSGGETTVLSDLAPLVRESSGAAAASPASANPFIVAAR